MGATQPVNGTDIAANQLFLREQFNNRFIDSAILLNAISRSGQAPWVTAGPIVGTAIFVLLPELARPLAENRFLLHGALLIAVITFLPQGIVDSLRRRRRSAARPGRDGEAQAAETPAA